ncbi:hypothetical protein E4K10_33370 [Streptomyces sp. T1317-0309]|nr:hypothetical protein E4K10_33370 [Streptomyces sp. T1317-0309]
MVDPAAPTGVARRLRRFLPWIRGRLARLTAGVGRDGRGSALRCGGRRQHEGVGEEFPDVLGPGVHGTGAFGMRTGALPPPLPGAGSGGPVGGPHPPGTRLGRLPLRLGPRGTQRLSRRVAGTLGRCGFPGRGGLAHNGSASFARLRQ